VVSLESIRGVPPGERGRVHVRERLEPDPEVRRVAPEAPLTDAITTMGQTGAQRLLVVDGAGSLAGFLTGTGLARFLELRQLLAAES
jgi:CBS domain-containing protein